MTLVIDILSGLLIAGGAVFYVIGAVGLHRMPDVFTRMHAASVSETMGVGLLMLGMILQAGFTLVAVKLVFITLVLWTTGAVASHALARAALHAGEHPLLSDGYAHLEKTDPIAIFPELRVRLAMPLSSEAVADTMATLPEEERRLIAEQAAPPERGAS
ncbi:MAG: monovalent cation/H(+) antiporter subunit G [Pseudomonadota bacterium]